MGKGVSGDYVFSDVPYESSFLPVFAWSGFHNRFDSWMGKYLFYGRMKERQLNAIPGIHAGVPPFNKLLLSHTVCAFDEILYVFARQAAVSHQPPVNNGNNDNWLEACHAQNIKHDCTAYTGSSPLFLRRSA